MIKRIDNRLFDQLRNIKITRDYTEYAEGSILVEFGATKVICNASVLENVPKFLLGKNHGWVTAEYSMLPRATHTRNNRDSVSGKVNARSQEISRLIGRSMRSCIDLVQLGNRQIILDCDVLQADGGTRTASITGAFVALYDSVSKLITSELIKTNPIRNFLAAVSVGIYQGEVIVDLNYEEDSKCDTDMNVVMLDNGGIVEIQGTAENNSFSKAQLDQLLDLAHISISHIIQLQKSALNFTK